MLHKMLLLYLKYSVNWAKIRFTVQKILHICHCCNQMFWKNSKFCFKKLLLVYIKKWFTNPFLPLYMGNLNRIQFGIGPSSSEKKRTQKTGSISFLNIFFMKLIQILLIIIMKWIQCWTPLVCKEDRICKICMSNQVGVVFLPCGHLISCVNCSPKVKDCPFCRQFIKGKVKTYMS